MNTRVRLEVGEHVWTADEIRQAALQTSLDHDQQPPIPDQGE